MIPAEGPCRYLVPLYFTYCSPSNEVSLLDVLALSFDSILHIRQRETKRKKQKKEEKRKVCSISAV